MPPETHKHIIRATLIGFFAPVLWSIYPTLVLLTNNLPPFEIVAYSYFFSFCFNIIFLLYKGINPIILLRQPGKFWLIGTLGISGFNILYISALKIAPPAQVFLVITSWPIMSIILANLLLKEKLHLNHIIGGILGFCGIIFIALNMGLNSISNSAGFIYAFLAAILWAIYSITVRKMGNMPYFMIAGFCGVTALLAAILHITFEPNISINLHQLLLLTAIGLGPSGASYYFWNYGVKNGDIRILSTLSFVGHFIAVSTLILFGFSQFSWHIATAFTLIISGALIGSIGLFYKRALNT